MPLYVKPDRKVSVRDIQQAMRDHYEGTPLDITNDMGAGAFQMPYRLSPLTFKVDGQEYFNERPISTQQSAFTFVSQMRSTMPAGFVCRRRRRLCHVLMEFGVLDLQLGGRYDSSAL